MRNSSVAWRRGDESLFERWYYAAPFTGTPFAGPELPQSWLLEGLNSTGVGSQVFLLDALGGTGARIVQVLGSGEGHQVEVERRRGAASARSARDQVRFIQASLGLTVAQLSGVLGVERQTIYNWLQAEQPPALQARTRTRLAQISDIARQWNQRCPLPAGKLAASLDLGGETLLKLLSQRSIDELAVQIAMDALAAHIKAAREQRRAKIRTQVPPPESADDRILRSATGIRFDTAKYQD